MFSSVPSKPTFQSWSPWRKGWPRLIWSTFVTLYLMGLTCAIVGLILISPLAGGVTTYGKYTISGPMYQGNIFSGLIKDDWIKTISLYPEREGGGGIQSKAWRCTLVCHRTPDCHTFVIKDHKCYLTSLDICKDASNRYLLEWAGATTYELRPGDDDDLHQTCLAQCLESKSCDKCGRPLCNGSQCENCPSSCWEVTSPKSGYLILYPSMSRLLNVSCNGEWQRWWKDGKTQLYSAILIKFLQVRVVLFYKNGLTFASDFESFSYKYGKITVGEYVNGTAGNGWGAPFTMRPSLTPPMSNCRLFFYAEGPCQASGLMSYAEQFARDADEIETGYFWDTENESLREQVIESIELWIKPQAKDTK